MDVYLFQILLVLSPLVFIVPKKWHHSYSLILQLGIIAVTSSWAVDVLFFREKVMKFMDVAIHGKSLILSVDSLSGFFILVINFTILTGILYAKGYLAPYKESKTKREFSLHYFSYIWIHISMLMVAMIRDGFGFLLAWELMAVSSFLLVIFDSQNQQTIKIGLNYLIQMHIGFMFIIVGFVYASISSGAPMGFDGLTEYFRNFDSFPVFILFFIGFGIKAGFMPLHTWLPHAHPAAPSHVSGVMSGVMIKMGIYGILRVLTYIQTDLLLIGYFILAISLVSGVLGVMFAIVQHDIKRLLAYHSIENIGIIGIGIGLGVIGIASDIPVLAVLGFTGGILHILNHSLFKSLLFFSAGSVYKQTHTRHIEHLGGLIKKMPKTALLFLLGALAICGLPPFNGFISEFLIYTGMLKGLQTGGVYVDVTILFAIIGLTLIGGLAIFCFTKIFGIMFLGSSRSEACDNVVEVTPSMILPQVLIGVFIVLIGFFPTLFVGPIASILTLYSIDISSFGHSLPAFQNITLGSTLFVGLILVLWFVKRSVQRSRSIVHGPTWGCGYTGADPAIHQYTATSYADSFQSLAAPIVGVKKHYSTIEKDEIFPEKRKFETHADDPLEKFLVGIPVAKLMTWIRKIGVLQTGNIRHYILYGLLFVILIFCLTLLNII